MKIILKRDIAKIGRKNEVKEVSEGYAQNFLFPRGLAEVEKEKKIEHLKKESAEKESKKTKDDARIIEVLKRGESLILQAKSNEKGNLFVGINIKQVLETFKKKFGLTIPESALEWEGVIKSTGEHSVVVRVGKWKGNLNLRIESD